ncbi:hypothetical protein [Chamaesiphon sp. VAR_48_metabat_403]|uniref:hypothetical protein n=1 Tax=Chamaesiphon sp. VAR_48_metabat_403 TaxID=2964700 RepID=UPI00286D6F6C|nr:hypothetical protein [Chamaesiphon sp. VAR_48_metabat_403]
MADADRISNRTLNLTDEEIQIVGYFAQGQKHFITSPNLKLEYTDTSIRLSDRDGKLLGISKQVNQWQRKVLVSNNSVYRPSMTEALIKLGFIDKQKSSHPEFSEHHLYQVPNLYKLNYTEVIKLWKVWWNNKRYQLDRPNPPIDVLTFTKGNWYLVRDLQPKQGNFVIRTERGEMTIEPEEYVVWLDAIDDRHNEPKPTSSTPSFTLEPPRNLSANLAVPIDSNILSSTSLTTTGSPKPPSFSNYVEPIEELDLESYLNTFNTEDSEDIDRIEGIYNIGDLLSGNTIEENVLPLASLPTPDLPVEPAPAVESPIPTKPVMSMAQRQAELKRKAMTVLAKYLQEGDRITHTEVLKNAQGQELNRKITQIQRGCPSWAIDQIQKLQE